MEMLDNPVFWVAVAFIVFVALVGKRASKAIVNHLDGHSKLIAMELNEAQRLREEAEAVLADYKRKQAEYTKEAETIIANAQRDADTLRSHAEKELSSSLEARMKQALDRIAQEESKAIADVREHVVDIALAAARNLIAEHADSMSQDELITLALSDIERKIH